MYFSDEVALRSSQAWGNPDQLGSHQGVRACTNADDRTHKFLGVAKGSMSGMMRVILCMLFFPSFDIYQHLNSLGPFTSLLLRLRDTPSIRQHSKVICHVSRQILDRTGANVSLYTTTHSSTPGPHDSTLCLPFFRNAEEHSVHTCWERHMQCVSNPTDHTTLTLLAIAGLQMPNVGHICMWVVMMSILGCYDRA